MHGEEIPEDGIGNWRPIIQPPPWLTDHNMLEKAAIVIADDKMAASR